MGEYRVVISDAAKQDILDTAAYITHTLMEPAIAEKTTEAIIDAIITLEDMPARIGVVKDERLAYKQIRGLLVKSYTAFFRIDEGRKTVEIIRVMHSQRDWPSLI